MKRYRPVAVTIQNRNQPSAPSWARGLDSGPKARSRPRSSRSKPRLRMRFSMAAALSGLSGPARGDQASVIAPKAVDDHAGDDERDAADAHADEIGVLEPVGPGARVVDGAEKADAVDHVLDRAEPCAGAVDQLLQRLE